jgi:hypothetical protein
MGFASTSVALLTFIYFNGSPVPQMSLLELNSSFLVQTAPLQSHGWMSDMMDISTSSRLKNLKQFLDVQYQKIEFNKRYGLTTLEEDWLQSQELAKANLRVMRAWIQVEGGKIGRSVSSKAQNAMTGDDDWVMLNSPLKFVVAGVAAFFGQPAWVELTENIHLQMRTLLTRHRLTGGQVGMRSGHFYAQVDVGVGDRSPASVSNLNQGTLVSSLYVEHTVPSLGLKTLVRYQPGNDLEQGLEVGVSEEVSQGITLNYRFQQSHQVSVGLSAFF